MTSTGVRRYTTEFREAADLIAGRQHDEVLRRNICRYLDGDIPEHFRDGPILYLSRHVTTPSLATLRFVEYCQKSKMSAVIGQDKDDIFVSHNSLKRALGKMPVVRGITRAGTEIIEYFTILDFAVSQGKAFKNIHTTFGVGLIEYHNDLFRSLGFSPPIKIIDESAWVTRHHRGDLIAHYKKILALLLVHGIMFEYYEDEDRFFVDAILQPAFEFVYDTFGLKPLIVDLVSPALEHGRNWHSYPNALYKRISQDFVARCVTDQK